MTRMHLDIMEMIPLLIIFATLLVGGVLTVCFHGFIFYRIIQKTHGINAILTVCVTYQCLFGLFGIFHSSYSLFNLLCEDAVQESVMFWSALPLYALRMVLPISSVFLAADRLMSMKCPMQYKFSISKKLDVVAAIFTTVVLLVNFVVYLCNREPSTASPYIFGRYVKPGVIYALSDVYNGFCILNIILTVLFVKFFFSFVSAQRRTRTISPEQYRNVHTTNVMVFYQLIVEFVFEVIPSLATSIAQYGFNTNWPQQIGPYVLALQVVYTTICSVTYTWKTRVCKCGDTIRTSEATNTTHQYLSTVSGHVR
ncbi:hypothetical protein QR680_013931 [Steinernema hermaphroditum]|uniref:Uncharacterized protein n=1 Tax=Steinernema hermaphroditum TaxID=289476 RepID=A0AA39I763_9BILA|nr:hypothetical protein QR680_013931 [Steinernema hermaphroditum]